MRDDETKSLLEEPKIDLNIDYKIQYKKGESSTNFPNNAWEKDQHYEIPDGMPSDWKCHKKSVSTKDEQKNNDAINHLQEQEGSEEATKDWAIDVDFTEEEAEIIGRACGSVDDYLSNFSPCNLFDQTFHFSNIARSEMTEYDPRIIHAAKHLYYAVYKYNQDKELTDECLEVLGRGLHPFQDTTAHTKDYVYYGPIKWHNFFSCCGPQVDDVRYVDGVGSKKSFFKKEADAGLSHRYADLKTTSLWYLNQFRKLANLSTAEEVQKYIEYRREGSKKHSYSNSEGLIGSLNKVYNSIEWIGDTEQDIKGPSCCPCLTALVGLTLFSGALAAAGVFYLTNYEG